MIQSSPLQFVKSTGRHGVTLIELMVVMTIVAILASALIFALSAAQEAARKAKTKSMIAKMDSLLMENWEAYESRTVPISIPSGTSPKNAAGRRLGSLRKLQLQEIPDRWSDVPTTWEPTQTAEMVVHLRAWNIVKSKPIGIRQKYQGAECLYQIIANLTGDEGSRDYFSASDIGDLDGDGAPEFLDGWGRPIAFLRWPAGFLSSSTTGVISRITGDAANDHDPFDPMKLHAAAYRLVPLIYSAGPDGDFDILSNKPGGFAYSVPSSGWVDPYVTVISGKKMGTAYDTDGDGIEEWHDNIHNHMLEWK